MKHQELAEAFARGATRGTGSRMLIEDGVIYSYGRHFPIAKIYGDWYLFNSRGYSSSTSQHKSYVRRCLPQDRIIEILDCDPDKAEEQIKGNNETIKDLMKKSERARKRDYGDEIRHLLHQNCLIGKELLDRDWKELSEEEFLQECVLEAL